MYAYISLGSNFVPLILPSTYTESILARQLCTHIRYMCANPFSILALTYIRIHVSLISSERRQRIRKRQREKEKEVDVDGYTYSDVRSNTL